MPKLRLIPDGFLKGRDIRFDFDSTSRVGNDLVNDMEEHMIDVWLDEVFDIVTESSFTKRTFVAFLILEAEKGRH